MNRRDFVKFAAGGVAGSCSTALAAAVDNVLRTRPEKPTEVKPHQLWRSTDGSTYLILSRYNTGTAHEVWETIRFGHSGGWMHLVWPPSIITACDYLGTIEEIVGRVAR